MALAELKHAVSNLKLSKFFELEKLVNVTEAMASELFSDLIQELIVREMFIQGTLQIGFFFADYILMLGADINHIDTRGLTPLMIASMFDCPKTIEFLLERNANVNLRNKKSQNALFIAVANKNVKTVQALSKARHEICELPSDAETLIIAKRAGKRLHRAVSMIYAVGRA